MKNTKKIDVSTLIVIVLAFSITVIAIIASLIVDSKDDSKGEVTTTPELTFPPISDVPQRDDIKISYTEQTTDDTYEKDGIEYIFSSVMFPVIDGGYTDSTEKINDAISAFVTERVTIKSFEKNNAEEAYKRAQDDAIGFIEFEFITRAESVYVKNGYISIMFRRVRTVGISEPKEDITTLCFDLLTGNEVDISAFLNVTENEARSFVLDVFTQHIRINPKLYYNDALETLPDIIDLRSFYLTENGLMLYFNPDIITPSVMGIRDFTVPYDKIGH